MSAMGNAVANPYGDKICPECGKGFFVNLPEQWVYKRTIGNTVRHFCSWKCVRAFDKKTGERKKGGKMRLVTDEQKKEAVRIVLDGGDPRPFLEGLGVKAPEVMWYDIKGKLKLEDPETYGKLPRALPPRKKTPEAAQEEPKTAGDAMALCAETADKFFDDLKAMGILKAETPEQPKITKPLNYDGMTVREVEGSFARYRRSDVSGSTYIDVEVHEGCDTLSYTVEQWRSFRKEHEKAAAILGVEL